MPREALQDDRVDAVLYFLPTNARMAESDLDTTVINAVARYAPVIPVMCKVQLLLLSLCSDAPRRPCVSCIPWPARTCQEAVPPCASMREPCTRVSCHRSQCSPHTPTTA